MNDALKKIVGKWPWTKLRIPPWWVSWGTTLFILLFLEQFSHSLPNPMRFYAGLVFRQQPFLVSWHVLAAGLRVSALFFGVSYLVWWSAPKRIKGLAFFSPVLGYGIGVGGSLLPQFVGEFMILISVAMGILVGWKKRDWILPNYTLFGLLLLSLGGLTIGHPPAWQKEIVATKKSPDGKSPSFLLLAADSIPEAIFEQVKTEGDRFASVDEGIRFSNAYTSSNSTYTSWHAVLSGLAPVNSRVQSLFPRERYDEKKLPAFLPRLLRDSGYRTVFMTDCANTSHFSAASGFEERYQPDLGAFACARGLVFSKVAAVRWVKHLPYSGLLFPEVRSDCGNETDPKYFFSKVNEKIEELVKEERPFLLCAHTCTSSAEAVGKNFKEYKNQVVRTLTEVDWLSSRLLAVEKPLWQFYFSDHGVRLDPDAAGKARLSHAVGMPVSRYQYNVPLWILGPAPRWPEKMKRRDLVALLDIYPTVLSLAKLKNETSEGVNLLEKAEPRRKLILTSAFPAEPTDPDFSQILRGIEVNRAGTLRFSADIERRFAGGFPYASLQLPYRDVWISKGHGLRFQELSDPYGLTGAPLPGDGVVVP